MAKDKQPKVWGGFGSTSGKPLSLNLQPLLHIYISNPPLHIIRLKVLKRALSLSLSLPFYHLILISSPLFHPNGFNPTHLVPLPRCSQISSAVEDLSAFPPEIFQKTITISLIKKKTKMVAASKKATALQLYHSNISNGQKKKKNANLTRI